MTGMGLTRRKFIELAGGTAASFQVSRGVPVEALSVPTESQDSLGRTTLPVNQNWRFMRQMASGSDIEAQFVGAEKSGYDDSSWPEVWLPHSWDLSPDNPFSTRGHFRGIGWYRTYIDVPSAWRERIVLMNFKGVFQVAEVWLNGVHLGGHVGGYTGFLVELTQHLKLGEQNLIAVKVDDTLSPYIAPAIETNVAVYGGIYRTVSLTVLDQVHIPQNGLWVTWERKDGDALVTIHGSLLNGSNSPTSASVEYQILDHDGVLQAHVQMEARVKSGEWLVLNPSSVVISDPRLWSPDSPHLYVLQTTVRERDRTLDRHSIRFGIRFMAHDPARGFLLNGEPINLHGVNRRQDYGFLGDAVPEAVGVKDVRIMKQMGANFFRTAHYPQDPAILDACDELGILVWEEIPNIKLCVYPPDIDLKGDEGISSTRFSRPFMNNLKVQLQEMIEQNRNHPSIIIWGLGDDLSRYQYTEDFLELIDTAHSLDQTRWTAGRVPHVTDIVDATVYDDLLAVHDKHPEGMYIWNEWGVFQSERGKEGQPLIRPHHAPFMADSEAAMLCEGLIMQWNALPWLGTAIWCMCDCSQPGSSATLSLWDHAKGNEIKPRWPVDDYKGCLDMWRLPKNAFYFLQSQWTEKPMVHIAGHWTWPGESGKPRQIRVYSNCDSVELFLNGRSLGSRRPATNEEVWNDFRELAAKYNDLEAIMDNGKQHIVRERLPGSFLRHAPFIWNDIPYQSGNLTAIGKKDGATVQDERRTAGEMAQLSLISDQAILAADGQDVALIQAHVLDSNGVLIPTAHPWISFSVDGPARLLGGTTEIDAISGIAAINVQSSGEIGPVLVHAKASGLISSSLELLRTAR